MPRRPDDYEAEKWTYPYAQPAITVGGTAVKLYKVPAGRTLRLTRASYVNPTGLAGDNTNAMMMEIKNGSTVACLVFNTDTNDATPGVTLAANTFVEGTLSATESNRVFAAGDEVSVLVTEDGDTTLPAGQLTLEGYLY